MTTITKLSKQHDNYQVEVILKIKGDYTHHNWHKTLKVYTHILECFGFKKED